MLNILLLKDADLECEISQKKSNEIKSRRRWEEMKWFSEKLSQ